MAKTAYNHAQSLVRQLTGAAPQHVQDKALRELSTLFEVGPIDESFPGVAWDLLQCAVEQRIRADQLFGEFLLQARGGRSSNPAK
jgi:hypothetical protein